MGVSGCYSWEAINGTENNYLFFKFLVFLIIQSSFTDGVSTQICWSFVLPSITPPTEMEEIIRLINLHILPLRKVHAEEKDTTQSIFMN